MEVENLSKDELEDLIKKAQNQIVVVENKETWWRLSQNVWVSQKN